MQQRTVSTIELGHSQARPGTLRKLAEALDVEIVDLVEDPVPKDGAPSLSAEDDQERRRGNIEVPESMKALLWERTGTMPIVPLPYKLFRQLFLGAESDAERERLLAQVHDERAEVLMFADEVRRRLDDGARISATGRERALEVWLQAANTRERTARDLTRQHQQVGA